MNFSLDEQLKKRLIGAGVLLSLLVIFLPSFWETDYSIDSGVSSRDVPESPFEKEKFQSKVQPLPSERPTPTAISTPDSGQEVSNSKPPPAVTTAAVEKPRKFEAKPQAPVRVATRQGANLPPLSSWAVQVASFPEKSSATKLIRDLQKLDYPAFLVPVNIQGKRWYRVRIGPEVDKKRAVVMVDKLRKIKGKGLNPSIIRHP